MTTIIRYMIMSFALLFSASSLAAVRHHLHEIFTVDTTIDLIISIIAAMLGGIGNSVFKTKNPEEITAVRATLKQDLLLSALAGAIVFFASLSYLDEPTTQLVVIMLAGWLGGSGIDWAVGVIKNTISKDTNSTTTTNNEPNLPIITQEEPVETTITGDIFSFEDDNNDKIR